MTAAPVGPGSARRSHFRVRKFLNFAHQIRELCKVPADTGPIQESARSVFSIRSHEKITCDLIEEFDNDTDCSRPVGKNFADEIVSFLKQRGKPVIDVDGTQIPVKLFRDEDAIYHSSVENHSHSVY
ncbi:hypothetical protein TURU_057271 [Turdus rufiventris]|nr:hypothetical protein TURU_057271 [Turdus rufiventris]